jgi:sulfite exporter TauE/SafE
LLEDILVDSKGEALGEGVIINKVNVSLKNQTVEIETDSEKTQEEILDILNPKIVSHKYILSIEKNIHPAFGSPQEGNQKVNTIWRAVLIGVLFLVLFFWLQKSGILNIGLGGNVTPTTSFIIGLIASVSSCLAIVGGLVLSLSAKISEDNVSDTKTFILFHIGRLVSFALLGGLLGLLGNAIGINFTFTAILGIIASLIMLALGFNLVGIFSINKVTLHAGIFQKINSFFRKIEHKTLTPLLIGFGTFFLPCGFTQSMQFVALSSGSFMTGMLVMLAFALGTLPVLAFLSFGSASFAHSKYAPLFFKSAGVVVIGFGLFALLGGLAGLGIIKPLFNI